MRDGFRGERLRRARHAFEHGVPFSQQRYQNLLDHIVLADDGFAYFGLQVGANGANGIGRGYLPGLPLFRLPDVLVAQPSQRIVRRTRRRNVKSGAALPEQEEGPASRFTSDNRDTSSPPLVAISSRSTTRFQSTHADVASE